MKFFALSLLAIPTLHADLLCVDINADNGGDGSSWPAAFNDLQDALAVAGYGDSIRVAVGTYHAGTNRSDAFHLPAGVEITGGWSIDSRNPDPANNGTILSGDIDGDGSLAGNSHNVVNAFASDDRSLLDGFTITGGNADGPSSPSDRGAGVTMDAGAPRLHNIRFIGNEAKYGGAVHMNRPVGTPTFVNVAFLNNHATSGAGAAYLTNLSHPTFTNCLFADNTGGAGGALRGFSSDPVFTNCTFVNNFAEVQGGIIFGNNGTNPTFINCILWNNRSNNGGQIDTNAITVASSHNLVEGGGWPGEASAVISEADPLFISANDFALQENSPALNLGLNSANSTTADLAQQPRFNGVIDLGPLERLPEAEVIIREKIIAGMLSTRPEEPDRIFFSFTSEVGIGASYQPQYLADLATGEWIDLADAKVEPIDGEPGSFLVSAPSFGEARAFYRVIETSEVAGSAPIASGLNEAPKPKEDQLLLLTGDFSEGGPVTGNYFSVAKGSPDGAIPRSLKDLPGYAFSGDVDGDGSTDNLNPEPGTLIDSLSVDLTGNGMPNPVFAWAVQPTGPNAPREVKIVLPEVNGEGRAWEGSLIYDIPGDPMILGNGAAGHIRLVTLQLDDDELPEIALAYTDENEKIHLVLIDFNGDLEEPPTLSEADTSTDLVRGTLWEQSARFDLAAGDFDADPDTPDQVALVTVRRTLTLDGFAIRKIYTRFFSTTGGQLTALDELTPEETELFSFSERGDARITRIAAIADDLDGIPGAELAVGIAIQTGSNLASYLRVMRTDAALTSMEFPASNFPAGSGSDGDYPLTLLAIPLDGEAGMELVFAYKRVVSFYKTSPNLSVNRVGRIVFDSPPPEGDGRRHFSYARLQLSDKPASPTTPTLMEAISAVTSETVDDEEVFTSTTTVKVYEIVPSPGGEYTFSTDPIFTETTTPREVPEGAQPFFTLATSSFDPLDLRLGVPRLSTRTVAERPTVVVNSPPLHFDILDGMELDVADLFPVGDPGSSPFSARFISQDGTTTRLETEWKRSWDASVTTSGGVSLPFGLGGLEVEVRSSLGKQFEDYTSETETVTTDLEITSVSNDFMYASTLDYQIWEYPVILNGDTVIGTIILVEPGPARQKWFTSKSESASDFRHPHEVGNLLSYTSSENVPADRRLVRSLPESDTFELSPGGIGVNWKLTRDGESAVRDSNTFNFSFGASLNFEAPSRWIPAVAVTGDYDSSKLRASSTLVTDSQGLQVKLGPLNSSFGGSNYSVTPYVYWDRKRSGALVLDYAVDLNLGSPNEPNFWRDNYGTLPDPTFILPWRLDPEKEIEAVSDLRRELTREISTLPMEPSPGQRVKVQARISNFSLLAVGDAFGAAFYLGDPRTGGELLYSQTVNSGTLGARGKTIVEFDWTVPRDISTATFQIFCVLDRQEVLAEIHEDNNLGWNEIKLRLAP